MDKAEKVFACLQKTFGLQEDLYESFRAAWDQEIPWEFEGSVKKPHEETSNAAVQGKIVPGLIYWAVILSPECFSVQPHSIRWECAIQSTNTFLKGFPISQS